MNFVTRFFNEKSGEDKSYYVEELGTEIMFEEAIQRLYFVVVREKFTRVGPTMYGNVLSEEQAQVEITNLRQESDWKETNTPFKEFDWKCKNNLSQ